MNNIKGIDMTTHRVFVIGDPHFREGCVRDMELFIEETLRIIGENKARADRIVVLGDVMDRHGILHQKPYHQSCRFLIELSKILPTICLIGNHDFDIPSKYLPENHPYKVMTWTKIPNLTIIDKPQLIDGVFYTPYVPPGMFNRAIQDVTGEGDGWESLVRENIGLVFAHQEFLGCQMGRLKSESGDPWPQDNYGKVPFVVSGHIHDHQLVGENILYVGTPVQVNYGEGVKKGICILTIHLDPMPVGDYSLEWFSIRVPKKIVKTISLTSLDRWVHQRFHDLVSKYSLQDILTNIKTKGGAKMEGFESITNLYTNKELFSPLMQAVTNDRFIDSLRLQVMVNIKMSNTVLKNMINKVRELPLGVQQIYLTDANEVNGERTDGENIQEEERRGWLELYLETVSKDESKRKLLNEILNNLSKNT
jgi:hypothetical protein